MQHQEEVPMNEFPLVSIIVRTCGKPDVLRNAIESIQKQTYPNIEIVIVEDGENISESFVKKNFSNLNICYHATNRHVGRTKAGNIALQLAGGKYFNFLDEDDILLEGHVEQLINCLAAAHAKAAYAVAEEQQIRVKSYSPYNFNIKRKFVRYRHPFNRILLCYMNIFPIQSVLFSRDLYDSYGGFNEDLNMLEDWDLWLRYASHEMFAFENSITSVYYTPFKNRKKKARDRMLQDAQQTLFENYQKYMLHMTAQEINDDMNYILNVFHQRTFMVYLRKLYNYLLYKDR